MITVFDISVTIARASIEVDVLDNVLSGKILLDQVAVTAFTSLHGQNKLDDLRIKGRSEVGNSLDEFIGQEVEFEISSFSGIVNGGYFVSSLDELLKRPEQCRNCPEMLYLLEGDVLFPESSSDLIDNYILATNLVSALYDLAHFKDDREFSFVSPNRLTISLKYGEGDLSNAKLGKAISLCAELTEVDDHHTERRVEIFLTTLYDRLKSVDKNARLGYLLRHLDEMFVSYRSDYKIYAKDFTHNQMVAKFDSQNADYFEKLQKTVNDISAKVLTIPFAYILIAGQLTKSGGLKNDAIIIGASVFALLMSTLVLLQYGVLRQIKSDIDDFKNLYSDYIKKAPFSHKYKRLTTKVCIQKVVLIIIFLVVLLLFYMTFKIYSGFNIASTIELL